MKRLTCYRVLPLTWWPCCSGHTWACVCRPGCAPPSGPECPGRRGEAEGRAEPGPNPAGRRRFRCPSWWRTEWPRQSGGHGLHGAGGGETTRLHRHSAETREITLAEWLDWFVLRWFVGVGVMAAHSASWSEQLHQSIFEAFLLPHIPKA